MQSGYFYQEENKVFFKSEAPPVFSKVEICQCPDFAQACKCARQLNWQLFQLLKEEANECEIHVPTSSAPVTGVEEGITLDELAVEAWTQLIAKDSSNNFSPNPIRIAHEAVRYASALMDALEEEQDK